MPRLARGTQAVVDRLGVAEGAALGHLDRVDVADQVTDARVGRGELLGVAVVAVPPGDGQVVAELGAQPPAADARRAACGSSWISQPATTGLHSSSSADQRAHQPGLALAALAEQHEVVAGEQRRLELGQHGVVEADDARGTRSSPARSRASRLSRISVLTLRWTWPEARSSPRVVAAGVGVGHCFTLRPTPDTVEGCTVGQCCVPRSTDAATGA